MSPGCRLAKGGWIALLVYPLLTGCGSVAVAMLGVGANVGIAHQIGGHVFRTFSEPLPRVLQATEAALGRMEIGILGKEHRAAGGKMAARAKGRSIDIELESLSPAATRMKVVARMDDGFMVDAATALEIVVQTERQLTTDGGPAGFEALAMPVEMPAPPEGGDGVR